MIVLNKQLRTTSILEVGQEAQNSSNQHVMQCYREEESLSGEPHLEALCLDGRICIGSA